VRHLVSTLEQAIVNLLEDYGITAYPQPRAPGVYVEGSKIASLGLRIRHGRSYHGLSLNVAMDLSPFSRINPCGYPGLPITQLSNLGGPSNSVEVAEALGMHLAYLLSSNKKYSIIDEGKPTSPY
jgi:lipoyl(octanoyl) transferase